MARSRTCLIPLMSGFVLLGTCYLAIEFLYGMFPSPEMLARRYVAAMISEDIQAAVDLAGSDLAYQHATAAEVQKDIAQFGTTELRVVHIEVLPQGGSDRGVRVVRIHFEYRRSGRNEWQHGSTQILTDSHLPSLRYLCGRTP
jgi:hypothetical protein